MNHNKPILTQGSFRKDNDVEFFTPGQPQAISSSGIARVEVFYLTKKNGRLFDVTESQHSVTVTDNKVLIPQNEDGSYTISTVEGVSLGDYYYLVEDKSGNIAFTTLQNLRAVGQGKGGLSLALDVNALEGKHPISFTLTEDNPFQHIAFAMAKMDSSQVTVHFDRLLPEGSQVSLKTPQGHLIPLKQSLYVPKAYGKTVRDGSYQLVVTLPKGYRIEGETRVQAKQNEVHELALRLVKDASEQLLVSDDHQQGITSVETNTESSAVPTMVSPSHNQKKSEAAVQLPTTGDKALVKWSILGFLLISLAALFSRKKWINISEGLKLKN